LAGGVLMDRSGRIGLVWTGDWGIGPTRAAGTRVPFILGSTPFIMLKMLAWRDAGMVPGCNIVLRSGIAQTCASACCLLLVRPGHRIDVPIAVWRIGDERGSASCGWTFLWAVPLRRADGGIL